MFSKGVKKCIDAISAILFLYKEWNSKKKKTLTKKIR